MIKPTIKLGIMSAVHQEQVGFVHSMLGTQSRTASRRIYTKGNLWDVDCVCVLSGMGKVAAAMTATLLIEHYKVTHILFTGVAGAADSRVKIGDIVIARHLVQHDMNAAPLFPRFEIPETGMSLLSADKELSALLSKSANDFLKGTYRSAIEEEDRNAFKLRQPLIHEGLIASGDEFITSKARISALKTQLPDLLAVEMEGAAVAQVCMEMGVPFAVVRTISDNADEHSAIDFMQFIERVASRYSFEILKNLCLQLSNAGIR